MFSEIQKMYMKSNKICTICGKYVDNYKNIQASKTKRGTYLISHINCINYKHIPRID